MKESRKPKLLFISKGNAQFIINDKDLLSQHYQINHFSYPDKPGIVNFYYLFVFLIYCFWHTPKAKLTYIWFADFHTIIPTFISKIFSKPLVLIIGGYDAAKRPDLSYGAHCNPIRSKCIDLSCQWSSEVIVVSKFVRKHLLMNTSGKFSTRLLYNAIPERSPKFSKDEIRNYICTVCPGNKSYRYYLKGLDVFIECAKQLPQLPFIIIGPKGLLLELIKSDIPPNVKVITSLPHDKFMEFLNKVRIICQFSRYEAFGMSLLEGMQMGGMPMSSFDIGTSELMPEGQQYKVNINIIPEIVDQLHTNYKQDSKSQYYNTYVNNHFNIHDRYEKLLKLLKSIERD